MLRQATSLLTVRAPRAGLHDITTDVSHWLGDQAITAGLLTIFCRHTSASLVIQENADPDVQTDLASAFERLVPEDRRLYVHTMEGPDDMPAHIRAALTGVQLSIPLISSRLALGAWQGIYLFEHRASSHRRTVAAHLLGE